MRTAWKIFKKGHSGGLVSAIADGRARIRYERAIKNFAPRWLRKKGYYPLVFKRKKDAVFFAKLNLPIRPGENTNLFFIEKVETGEKIPLPQICSIYKLCNGEIEPTHPDTWPQGTMMVEWVRPFKSKETK